MASAVDINPSNASLPASSQPSRTLFPVAHEVRVTVTGARPGESSGQRELFTEVTNTVLVFENGGVIQLSAAVALGQLLFLTHEDSKREVVAQVIHKRKFRPTSCYVELQFTEPCPGFWGMDFPAKTELAEPDAQLTKEAELVQSAETTSDDPDTPPSLPSGPAIAELQHDVEVLREQLHSVEEVATHLANSTTPVASPADVGTNNMPLAPSELLKVSRPAENAIAESQSVLAKCPSAVSQQTIPEEATHPQGPPSFSPTSSIAPDSPELKQKGATRTRPGARRISFLFAALFLVAVGGAWYQHWLPWPPRSKDRLAASPSVGIANSSPILPAAPQTTPEIHSDSAKPGQGAAISAAGQTPGATKSSSQSAEPALDVAPSISSVSQSSLLDAPKLQSGEKEKSGLTFSAVKQTTLHASTKTPTVSGASFSNQVGIVPPKLIKSVRPNAPAEALRGFITGNVTLEGLVDPSGKVKSIHVVSGPATLREAAMEAFKQYKYAPATQKGKPVPSRVQTTIQFWYEP